MSTWGERLENSPLGNLLIGFALILMAPVVYGMLAAIDAAIFDTTINATVNGQQQQVTLQFSFFFQLLKAFAPLLMIYAGLRKLGVGL
ncbi:MAG: hypothetical protein GSR85_06925 [Desulfurococcales archaeon]|nr:hypothetical protein [Desulfurococcales archaeon]